MTTHAERTPCTLTHLSDFARVKVDLAQTGFFTGREYRSFKELNIAAAAIYVIKVVVPMNVILLGLELEVDDGWARMATLVGGFEGGVYGETLPKLNRNNMAVGPDREAVIASQLLITAGGTHTGGTELDVIRLRTSTATGSATTVGLAANDERGIAAGTYYFRFTNLGAGAITGMFRVRWEERA